MDFSESQHGCIIIEKLAKQIEAEHFCDVVIVLKKRKFRAHRNVLAACSRYFDSQFQKQKIVKEKITITKCKNVKAFHAILEYMYTGVIAINVDNIADIMSLANRFLIDNIKEYCEMYVIDHMNACNCISFLELAIKYKLTKLENNISEFIQNHISEILVQSEILKLNYKQLHLLMDKCHVFPLDLLEFFCKWVEFDLNSRRENFESLLVLMDWDSVNPFGLEKYVSECSFLIKDTKCLNMLLMFLQNKNIHLNSYKENCMSLISACGEDFLSKKSTSEVSEKNEIGILGEDTNKDSIAVLPISHTNLKSKLGREKLKKKSESSDLHIITTSLNVRTRSSSKFKTTEITMEAVEKENKLTNSANDDHRSKDRKPHVNLVASRRGPKSKKDPMWKAGVKCDKCSFVAYNPVRLANHASKIHSKDAIYKCKTCNISFTWSREYSSHMRIHYQGPPPYECNECKYTTDKIHYLFSHLFKHTDKRPYSCDQCGRSCTSQSKLKYHLRTHTGERPYACDQCELKFNAKSLLVCHLQTHSKERQFLCDICAFSSRHKKLLSLHMRTHTGNVFRCDFADCKFSATLKCMLKRHQQTHTGLRSFICSYCGAGFVQKHYLVKHERIHLNENPFKCEHCDYSSCRKDKLKEHVQKHHSSSTTIKGPFRPRKQRLLRINDDTEHTTNKAISNFQPVSRNSLTSNNLGTNFRTGSNNVSTSCLELDPSPRTHNVLPGGLNYDSHNPPTVNIQHQGPMFSYQAGGTEAVNMPYIGPPSVPVISHEIPTTFKSFMSFM